MTRKNRTHVRVALQDLVIYNTNIHNFRRYHFEK